MTVGYLFLLGSLVGFSLLGILHKVADHPSCRPRMVTMLLLVWAAALTAAYTLAFDPRGLRMPPSVLGLGGELAVGAAHDERRPVGRPALQAASVQDSLQNLLELRSAVSDLGLIGDGRGGVPDWFLQGLCA